MTGVRSEGLPRPVLWLGIAAAAVVLTGLFIVAGFPYDALGRTLSAKAREAGIEIDVQGLSPSFGIAGPAVRADTVYFGQGTERVELSDVTLRPGWSMSWLSGAPAIHVDLTSEVGNVAGTVTFGALQGFSGTLERVRLEALPLSRMARGMSATGLLDAEPDILLEPGEDGAPPIPNGSLHFRVTDGSLGLPNLPIGLPFASLEGDLRFGDENFATIDKLALDGPMVAGQAKGRIEASERGWNGPLDLEVELTAQDPMTRSLLKQSRVRLDGNGRGNLSIKGSLENPVVRGGNTAPPNPFE